MHRKLLRALYALTLLVACLAVPLQAQTFYGSVVGNVADANGAVVPTVRVVLVNLGTSERRTVETDDDGNFKFVNLVPGNYRVELEKAGFKRLTREPVVVEVQSAVRLDLVLQLGDVTQVVEITAQTPLLQPENTSLGQIVDSR